jgi:arylmalonate decarboxylase
VRFIGNGLGFAGMTIESYEEAIPRALPRAQELAQQGADLISVFGSSITFYRGAAFNQELTETVTKLTGLPATTHEQRPRRRVEARERAPRRGRHRYTDIVTERLKIFLEEHGFHSRLDEGPRLERIPEGAATQEILHGLGVAAYTASNKADALVMSCGGLRTLDRSCRSKARSACRSYRPHRTGYGIARGCSGSMRRSPASAW